MTETEGKIAWTLRKYQLLEKYTAEDALEDIRLLMEAERKEVR